MALRRLSALVVAPMTVLAFAAPASIDAAAPLGAAAHAQNEASPAADTPRSDPATPTDGALVARTAPVAFASTTATADVPPEALVAYHRAEAVINASSKTCHLPWQLLAAVGQIESDHGRRTPPAATPLADTDAGLYDGTAEHDLPIGPLQLTPQVWAKVAVDADGDGMRDATDLDDAALGLSVLLCSLGESLDTPDGQRLALGAHNTNPNYIDTVISLAADYAEPATLSARMTTPVLVGPVAPEQPAASANKKKPKRALRAESGVATALTPGKPGDKPEPGEGTNEDPAEEPTDQPPADGDTGDSDPSEGSPETPAEPEPTPDPDPTPGDQTDDEACPGPDETDGPDDAPADDETGHETESQPTDDAPTCADSEDDDTPGSDDSGSRADLAGVGQKSRHRS